MPLPIYSTRFLGWAAELIPPVVQCPGGYVMVVRDIDVYSFGGQQINFRVSINTIAHFWGGQFTIEAIGQVAQWRGRQVLNAGEELLFEGDGPTDGCISGYLLLVT